MFTMMKTSKRTWFFSSVVVAFALLHLVRELVSNSSNNNIIRIFNSDANKVIVKNKSPFGVETTATEEEESTRSHSSFGLSSFHEDLVWNPRKGAPRLVPTLNDKTMELSPHVQRPWIYDRFFATNNNNNDDMDIARRNRNSSNTTMTTTSTLKKSKPKVKILLTNYGWNHPNQTFGLTFGRSIRMRQLLQAIVDHPLFDPHGWEEYRSARKPIDPGVRYYVFLDVETCFESNYPNYGGPAATNADRQGGRPDNSFAGPSAACYQIKYCSWIQKVLDSPLFKLQRQQRQQGESERSNHTATLVYFDCRGDGPAWWFRKQEQTSTQLAIASISSAWDQLQSAVDQGLPPPAVSQINLSQDEQHNIRTCNESGRPYLLTFVGAYRQRAPVRSGLTKLHNASAGIITMFTGKFKAEFSDLNYNDMLKESKFAATPRGDNRFSYRFTEVLAAGAIPVVHSDGWVLPFRPELMDWAAECAVIIPEYEVKNRTLEILLSMSKEERCRRRRRCYEIYRMYMATPRGTMDGILQGLELVSAASNGAAS